MWKNFILILKTSQYGPFIFYSAVLVSMSHFFFWSFQPMMKMASISSILVGIVIFTNNMMRSFGSLLSQKIAAYIPLTSLGCVVLVMDLCGLFLGYILQNVFDIQWVVIAFVFYLCICIVLQLIFTIIHTSRLQQIATPNIRSQISGVNMMMARLFVAMCLIVPKYLMMYVSFVNMYLIYGILLSIVGSYLLYNLKKQ